MAQPLPSIPHSSLYRLCPISRSPTTYLWRAIDQEGNVLDILLQRRQGKKAAKKFYRILLKGFACVLRVIIIDKLKGYAAAKRKILFSVEHRQ